MIDFERSTVLNVESAMRGVRNPLQSWELSDSFEHEGRFILGPNDRTLARRLVSSGSDHRKFLRQIFVSVDITAPLYWWKEYDTYKVGTTANSTSTLHTIHRQPITREMFSCERLSPVALGCLDTLIRVIEDARQEYVKTGDVTAWNDIIQLLPSSFNQTRTCTLTFENLLAMYQARRCHKLPEWREFCAWAETLPYFSEICLEV